MKVEKGRKRNVWNNYQKALHFGEAERAVFSLRLIDRGQDWDKFFDILLFEVKLQMLDQVKPNFGDEIADGTTDEVL